MPHRWKSLDDLEPHLRRFLSTRSRDDAEIDDVLQETYLRAARYRESLEDPAKLRSWVFRIASNVLTDRIRRAARRRTVSVDEGCLEQLAAKDAEDEPEELVLVDGRREAREDVLKVLSKAMRELRDRDRDLLESFYGGAGSCRETADSCSMPERLVKVRLYRARTRLRRVVTAEVSRKRQAASFAGEVR